EPQGLVVVQAVAAAALAAPDRTVHGRAVRADAVVDELGLTVLADALDLVVHDRDEPVGRAIAGTDEVRLRLERVAVLDEQVARLRAPAGVPRRTDEDRGPKRLARNRLLVLERERTVRSLDRLPAPDGRRPAHERDLAVALLREERQRRAIGDGRFPHFAAVLVELRAREDDLAAIDLGAQLHLGATVCGQRRQADCDGHRQRQQALAGPLPLGWSDDRAGQD